MSRHDVRTGVDHHQGRHRQLRDAFDTFFEPRLEPVGAGSLAVAYEIIGGRRVTRAQEDAL